MKIKDLKVEDRPRERLIKEGAKALSDVELLAIILGSGNKNENVFDLSVKILKKYTFKELKELSYEDFCLLSGIKQAKACKLLACFEIAKRAIVSNDYNLCLEDSKLIYKFIKGDFYLSSNEKLVILFLDVRLNVIKKKVYDGDSPHNMYLPFKDIIRDVINLNCSCVVMAHNHPTNHLEPSVSDVESTIKLKEMLDNMSVLLLDHIIVGVDEYYSFNDNGLLLDRYE